MNITVKAVIILQLLLSAYASANEITFRSLEFEYENKTLQATIGLSRNDAESTTLISSLIIQEIAYSNISSSENNTAPIIKPTKEYKGKYKIIYNGTDGRFYLENSDQSSRPIMGNKILYCSETGVFVINEGIGIETFIFHDKSEIANILKGLIKRWSTTEQSSK